MHFVCSVDGFPACPLSFNQVWIIYLSELGKTAKGTTTTTATATATIKMERERKKKSNVSKRGLKSTFANRISPEQMLFWFVFSLVYGVRFLYFWWLMLFPRYHTYGSPISSPPRHKLIRARYDCCSTPFTIPAYSFACSCSFSLCLYVDALVQVCALKLVCENTITIGLYRANAIEFDTCSNSFFVHSRFSFSLSLFLVFRCHFNWWPLMVTMLLLLLLS